MNDHSVYTKSAYELLQPKQSVQLNILLEKLTEQLDGDDVDSLLQHLKFEETSLTPNKDVCEQIMQKLGISNIDIM